MYMSVLQEIYENNESSWARELSLLLLFVASVVFYYPPRSFVGLWSKGEYNNITMRKKKRGEPTCRPGQQHKRTHNGYERPVKTIAPEYNTTKTTIEATKLQGRVCFAAIVCLLSSCLSFKRGIERTREKGKGSNAWTKTEDVCTKVVVQLFSVSCTGVDSVLIAVRCRWTKGLLRFVIRLDSISCTFV